MAGHRFPAIVADLVQESLRLAGFRLIENWVVLMNSSGVEERGGEMNHR